MRRGESGEGGDAAARIHGLQLVLALVLPLNLVYPEADLRGRDKGLRQAEKGLGKGSVRGDYAICERIIREHQA